MPITPLNDYIVLTPPKPEDTSASGIILPSAHEKGRDCVASVEALGPGVTAPGLEKGATVVFSRHTPEEIEAGGETFLILQEKYVLGIFHA